ncbi:MAG: aminotransferase class III-fold pyridoxal phosphate-dependent enzyme [Halobacteriales archaeon]|nr:aminotransferase class III-fold pyridoxal phosphate-dependent enzyme [Halobacteriales archaeon]
MTMAKGLTGAYQPLGATIVTPEIADHFEDEMLVHGHTYAGHPVACAAGLAAVETYEREGLIERARERGAYLERRLEALAADHPSVGDLRGAGLFRGIELTRSADGRVPFGTREDKLARTTTVVDEVAATAREHGVYVVNIINTLLLAPPLVISEAELDEAVEALDAALEVADAAMDG